MRIAVIGTGYVGLVTGACLAELGHHVTCIDRDAIKIAGLQRGRSPFYEPGLAEMMARNSQARRLRFSVDVALPLRRAEAVFLAVGTPQGDLSGTPDLSFLRAAVTDVARHARRGAVVITKSTVPAGTGDDLARVLEAARPGAGLVVASNPEFLREGSAIADFMQPDRIVVGAECDVSRKCLADIFAPLGPAVPLLFTRRRNAELIKYASNAFLAMKVAFINEMADLCEALDGDVGEVSAGMGLDPRIGPRFLTAGPGYGGSCFPKDTAALAHQARNCGATLRLIEATIRSNERRKRNLVGRIVSGCGGSVAGKTIAVLGLTFKANTDDMRDAPALDILPALAAQGARLIAHDPQGMAAASALLPQVAMAADPYEAAEGADALVMLTEWPQFRSLDLDQIRLKMAQPLVFDFRHLVDPQAAAAAGIVLAAVGRTWPAALRENIQNDHRIVPFAAHSGGRGGRLPRIASGRPAGRARRPGLGSGQSADRPH